MKLYTKKITYSLLAIGLLACAPVVGGPLKWGQSPNCKRMCQGAFVQEANDKNFTGEIKKDDISFDLGGHLSKRQCICTYIGDLGIEKKKTFNQRDARKSGVQKELKKVRKHALSKKCDKTTEMCLIRK